MSSDPQPGRTLLLPAADFDRLGIPVTRQPRRSWFRVHSSGRSAVFFGRLPHHRFSHPDCPYALLYVGATIQTSLWEVFGDDILGGKCVISEGRWRGSSVSRMTVPEIQVCALNNARTREAMRVDKASLMASDLAMPQAWGLAVQRHPAGFQAIKYSSRFVDQACLALFDRDAILPQLKVTHLGSLSDLETAMDWLHERKAALV